jgi:hypothetical protein
MFKNILIVASLIFTAATSANTFFGVDTTVQKEYEKGRGGNYEHIYIPSIGLDDKQDEVKVFYDKNRYPYRFEQEKLTLNFSEAYYIYEQYAYLLRQKYGKTVRMNECYCSGNKSFLSPKTPGSVIIENNGWRISLRFDELFDDNSTYYKQSLTYERIDYITKEKEKMLSKL